eukprot:gene20527-30260_t
MVDAVSREMAHRLGISDRFVHGLEKFCWYVKNDRKLQAR